MGLGELYEPSGKAREQAQQVLEVEDPHAVNIAWGCRNGCPYCYGPSVGKQSREEWMEVRHPDERPAELVEKQLDSGLEPEGVFVSFLTDPFLKENVSDTEEVIELLLSRNIQVATSSKVGVSGHPSVRHGMTVVSLDRGFSETWEPGAPSPESRIGALERKHEAGEYTWVSLEPCPPPAIWDHDVIDLLEELSFVDFVVKGKWNYDRRVRTEEAKEYYRETFEKVEGFCDERGIRCHVKSESVEFAGGG